MLLSSRADATQNFTIPPLALASHVYPRDIEPFLVLILSDRPLCDSTSYCIALYGLVGALFLAARMSCISCLAFSSICLCCPFLEAAHFSDDDSLACDRMRLLNSSLYFSSRFTTAILLNLFVVASLVTCWKSLARVSEPLKQHWAAFENVFPIVNGNQNDSKVLCKLPA